MQEKPHLLIMAAGMASRYGGVKQLESVGPSGEIIMDYSIHAAVQAGYEDVIIVIKKDMEKILRRSARTATYINLRYAYQELEDLPEGYSVPAERVKPWGQGMLFSPELVDAPLTVINADDYYGKDAFKQMHFIKKPAEGDLARHALCT